MAKLQCKGLNEYAASLSKFSKKSEEILRGSVYVGAGIVADSIKEEMKSLPTDNHFGTEKEPIKGISKIQKADLIDSFGISEIRQDGNYTNAKLGWDGYGRIKTKKYPKGIPNQLIARSINIGTSFRQKNPFVDRAVRKSKKDAFKAMQDAIDKEVKKEMK